MDPLRRLIEHLAWADEHVQRSLEAAGERAPSQAIALYAHVIGAEEVWLARLTRTAPQLAVWPKLEFRAVLEVARDVHGRWRSYVAAIGPADLARKVAYTNSAGASFETSIEDIVMHVALHGAYHRGQIASLVSNAGAQAAASDYIAFVRGAPAATRTPL